MSTPPRKLTNRPKPTDITLMRADVKKLAKTTRLYIQFIAWVLAVGFAFVVISEREFVSLVEKSNPILIYKIGLLLYYSSWLFGARFDVNIEERVYLKDSKKGSLDAVAVGAIIIFTLIIFVFFYFHNNQDVFPFVLFGFICANIVGWRIVCVRIEGPITESDAAYRQLKDYFGLERLEVVSDYMRGRWQILRFGTMLGLAAIFIGLAFLLPHLGLDSRLRGVSVQGLPADRLLELAPALFFILYVLIAEGWMWIQRINVHHRIDVLDALTKEYRLVPKSPRASTQPATRGAGES